MSDQRLTLEKIIEKATPFTVKELNCRFQKQAKIELREETRQLILKWYEQKRDREKSQGV